MAHESEMRPRHSWEISSHLPQVTDCSGAVTGSCQLPRPGICGLLRHVPVRIAASSLKTHTDCMAPEKNGPQALAEALALLKPEQRDERSIAMLEEVSTLPGPSRGVNDSEWRKRLARAGELTRANLYRIR